MRIAIDGFGGDNAPAEIVKGVIEAVKVGGPKIVITGDSELLAKEFDKYGGKPETVDIFHAPQIVEMDESPSRVVRDKKESSLVQGAQLVKEGKASAFVSAGNTGATMAAGIFVIGRIKGMDRPAIATPIPGLKRMALLVDAGANSECKPRNLVQFAKMGQVFMEKIYSRPDPRVGLLNVGEEEKKGPPLYQEAYALLKEEGNMNFLGNIEGREIFTDLCDVVISDGFVGNVTLKVTEGAAMTLTEILKEEIKRSITSKIGALLMKSSLKSLKNRMDYEEYGGAPLLGVKAPVIISHGSSSAKAIKNAIFVARDMIEQEVQKSMEELLEKTGS